MPLLSHDKTRAAVDALVPFYEQLQPEDIQRFDTYYRHDASFRDPFNHVNSTQGIKRIFSHMFTQVRDPAFRVTKVIIGEGDAILFWTFHFRFKGLGCKRTQTLAGVTHLAFDETGLVTLHRDYWDAAEELYGRLPVIGTLMRGLQRMIRA
jgi:steroid delta-isomerase